MLIKKQDRKMDSVELSKKKYELIESLSKKGIHSEKVLKAISNVPREKFIDESIQAKAYEDRALPIGGDQTISQPYTVAYMTSLLDSKPGDKVLEIGTGSGYQSAVLCEMGLEVYSLERIESLYYSAKKILDGLNYDVKMYLGDGSVGLPAEAPFDSIIITAAAPNEPFHLLQQLKVGGKIVVPVGSSDSQVMEVIEKTDVEQFKVHRHSRFKFVPLIGEKGW